MNKLFRYLFFVLLVITMGIFMISCSKSETSHDVWDNALYTEDTTLGSGSKVLEVEVKADDKSVVFTVRTDKNTVGEALSEFNLISGEDGAYGMYVKKVNGIIADYEENKCYWSFCKNGEYMQTGIDKTEFSDGDRFELVYTRG